MNEQRTHERSDERTAWVVGLVVGLVLALVAVVVPLNTPPAQAQSFAEGPDYAFSYRTFTNPTVTIREDWNAYGGPTQLPYYIHVDLIADGFESAIRSAFATWESDPGSDVSFVYMGSTTVLSEYVVSNGILMQPSDDINVVSYRSLPAGPVGIGGFSGPFFRDPTTGLPTGEGTGHFDISLSPTVNWSTNPGTTQVDIESLVLHEIGHVLGLAHPTTNQNTVMWASLTSGVKKRALHPADQFALALLYGCDTGGSACAPRCNGVVITHDMNELGVTEFVGTAGDDVILGTPDDDTIDAGAGNDTVCAGSGDDEVVGGDGDDTMFGGAGNDLIRGNAGADTIEGGPGTDRLLGGIDGDTMRGGDSDDYIGGFGGPDTIDGGAGSDRIFGGFGADVINGGAGADVISGLVGDDTITGGTGADILNGDRGQDTIRGGSGNDTIGGGNSDDFLFGDFGFDRVSGGKGNDQLSGGEDFFDVCIGNTGIDTADVTCETIFGVP